MRAQQKQSPRANHAIVRSLQTLNVCFCRVYHQLTVHAPQCLPRNGPAILVCNHISGLDPMLIQSVCPRMMTWMMAKEYYEVRGLKWVFEHVGAIPVERSGRDLTSTRAAMRALGGGAILGVFPEGRIETSHDILPFQTGVALMAMKTGVPVYPAWLEGTQRGRDMVQAVLSPCRASIAFGSPIDLRGEFDRKSTSKEDLEASTQKIANAVRDLRDKYAGKALR